MKYKINGDKIEVIMSFELKDLFRDTFRTAKWNHPEKHWYVNNTPANIKKLDLFQISEEVQTLLRCLNDIDRADMPEAQLQKINAVIDAENAGMRRAKRNLSPEHIELFKERTAARQTHFEAISKATAKKLKAFTTANEHMRPTYEAMLAPYTLNGHTVPEVLIQAVKLAMDTKTPNPTIEQAHKLKDLVIRLEWLKNVQAEVIKSHMVNFTYLSYPLTAANIFFAFVSNPEQAKDWLFDTVLIELPTKPTEMVELERKACSAVMEEVKPQTKSRFKI